jgi:hypothetical protein
MRTNPHELPPNRWPQLDRPQSCPDAGWLGSFRAGWRVFIEGDLMKHVNLLAIFAGLLISNFAYQYFVGQIWRDAVHSSFDHAVALLCVYLAGKAAKP